MWVQARRRHRARFRKLAASVFAVLVAFSTLGMPTASAGPQDDIWRMINDQHIFAGCRGYGGDPDLANTAVYLARSMANNDGQVPSGVMPTEQLLGYNGYRTEGYGDMRFYNPNGASAQDAVDFWMNANTRDLPKACGLQQMAVGVWMIDGNFAAVALMGTRV